LIGYRIPIGSGLLVEAGLFTSPIGPESLTVHQGFNFSRSNLCFGLPFYHAGIRFTYEVDRNVSLLVWAINGWNAILDNNDDHAASPIYYQGTVANGATGWTSNAFSQDTLTFGTTAWF